MFRDIQKLFSLLTPIQRKHFIILQVLVVLMAVVEIVGIASILPFMTLVGDMSLINRDTYLSYLYQASGVSSESQFIFLLGISVLAMLIISASVSMYTIWKLSLFANRIGVEISGSLYTYYLRQNWLFHTSVSSAQLTKKIATETQRVTQGVLVPLMHMNAKGVLAILLSVTLFIYDPIVALVGIITFSLAYIILYRFVRFKLHKNGQVISEMNEKRFYLKNEGFGGIKDILLIGRGNDLIKRFNQTGDALANSQGGNAALAHAPRYFMELVAFGSMILLVLYLTATHNGNLGIILPILSVYALAGFKLLPALQQIYASAATIKGSISAFESIQDDLSNFFDQDQRTPIQDSKCLHFERKILLENVSFTYPNKTAPAINELNISIPVNSFIGVVGPSGAGKSTLVDIILGLISPQNGRLIVDETTITTENCRLWQNDIGFVAQSIFLSDASISENIAFGVQKNEIDFDKVRETLKLAQLTELVDSLEKGIDAFVGERGVQLSGGQRQRIGIARALYHDAKLLVFDEATSSLDGITEKMIMESITNLTGKKTIVIIAHRLKTVKKCDRIFFMDQGKVIDEGSYDKLIETNDYFKKMASHA
jgi:HlyD family secretion protein